MELKEKFRQRKKTLGSWITVPHRFFVEVAANAGLDWICIDLEHTTIDLDQMGSLISLAKAKGIGALVRITSLDENLIKRVMDAGATGLIVPMINSAEQAIKAYRAMHYPPNGKRGVGLSSAHKFGSGFKEYLSWLKENSILIVQIEHIDGVKSFKEILSRHEVDGFIIGPYDLSASLGKPGQFNDPEFLKAMEEIESIQSKFSKARGIHIVEPDIDQVNKSLQSGFDFIAYSFETKILDLELRKVKNVFR